MPETWRRRPICLPGSSQVPSSPVTPWNPAARASHSSLGSDDTQACSETSNHLQETATGQSGTTWHRQGHWAQGFGHNTSHSLAGQTSLCGCWQGRHAPNVDSAMKLVLASPGLPEPREEVLECTGSTNPQHAEGEHPGEVGLRTGLSQESNTPPEETRLVVPGPGRLKPWGQLAQ